MINDISEKGIKVNHKVNIVKFSGGSSEKILEILDDMIKEKPEDLIVHVGTNHITNNLNLLTNVIIIFNKVSKESPSTSIAFLSIINCKVKTNIQKAFIGNSGIKEFHLGKRKLHLDKKGNSAFAKKIIALYKQDR